MVDLHGKVAVVTGASRGLGQRAALRLAQQGASIALVARSEAALEELQQQIRSLGSQAVSIPADLSNPRSIDTLRETVLSTLGSPSILINAAGVFGPIDLVQDTDPDAWIETILTNTIAPYLTCRAFVPGMIEQSWGRIVNVSSAAALHEPGPINSAYGTSKAALNQFTRHLAAELAGTGVTANVIHPGDVKTDMWAYIKTTAQRLGPVADTYNRWADWVEETGGDDPEKAADLILDLMSDQAAAVNGEFLWIKDGLQQPVASWTKPEQSPPWRS